MSGALNVVVGVVTILFTGILTFAADGLPPAEVTVAVWEGQFDFSDKRMELLSSKHDGKFLPPYFLEGSQTEGAGSSEHFFKVSSLIAEDQPFVRILPVFHFFGWQDPEICFLADVPVMKGKLPLCYEEARADLKKLGQFLRDSNVTIVNMSWGTYFKNYVRKNPGILMKKFPELTQREVQRALYQNFTVLGELFHEFFRDHSDILFVLAGGSELAADIDALKPPAGDWSDKPLATVPTWFTSLAPQLDNVIAVTSSLDGKNVQPSSAWGKTSIDFAVKVDAQVPCLADTDTDCETGRKFFTGTSAAAPKLARELALMRAVYLNDSRLTPQQLKQITRESVISTPDFAEKTNAGGVFSAEKFQQNLARRLGPPPATFTPPPPDPTVVPPSAAVHHLKVVQGQGTFREYHLPYKNRTGKPESCEMVRVDQQGQVWMSITSHALVAKLDPATGDITEFHFTERTDPDGVIIDSRGRVWVGLYAGGKLGMIDPSVIDPATGQPTVYEFPLEPRRALAIPTADPNDNIWITSHQARMVFPFNTQTMTFGDPWVLDVEWPVAPMADPDGSIWVSGNINFKLLKSQSGALVNINPQSGAVKYFALPEKKNSSMTGSWLAQDGQYIYMSLANDGFFAVNRENHGTHRFIRRDGLQRYEAATQSKSKEHQVVAFGMSKEGHLAIDIFDHRRMNEITSYKLPTQEGRLKEGMDFSLTGEIWYCQTKTDVVGVLSPE